MAGSPPSTKPAKALDILIVGAGVCGPIFALIMQRANPNHNITVIERWPTLRTGGQQLDLKAQCIEIMRRLGLLEELRKVCVQEPGIEIVNSNGKKLMQLGVTKAGDKGTAFEITNEFEFMRGDFVKIAYNASLKDRENLEAKGHKGGSLTYMFNTSLTGLSQSADSPTTTVTLSTGATATYDLVVAADGQASRTRRLAFGEAINKAAFHSLNIHVAFYNIPRLPSDTDFAHVYVGTQNRHVLTRTGNCPFTQVYLFQWKSAQHTPTMQNIHSQPLDVQKRHWSSLFRPIGWQSERFTDELEKTEDFYATEIAQVKMPDDRLFNGSVVLLGDAGYCPSSMTGKGTTLSIAGAYTLAGELAANPDDVGAALKGYETRLRPLIDDAQQLKSWLNNGKGPFPQSSWGLWLLNNLLWVVSTCRVDRGLAAVAGWMAKGEKEGWKVPDYKMNTNAF
ncbi:hypothetical protein yc1106_01701 [Curvularia clavata]|uniref:FAD-binding domain-containing protein n=1 Tax=Curvularia clavata TaxID=95742 RepID=A0A9Q8Z1K4_CURCL|nr:hypothetical protein yc1106_01701 [Curvularia clavata]